MIKDIKSAFKVLTDYFISLILFAIFLIIPVGLAKDNFYRWLPVYSFIIFLVMFTTIYSDMKKLAVKEKRPQYNIKHYPFKGFILGLMGILPIIFIELAYPLVFFNNAVSDRIKHVVLNTLLGPLYTFISAGNETVTAYAVSTAIVPLIAMLGYLAGYYSFDISIYFKKSSKKISNK